MKKKILVFLIFLCLISFVFADPVMEGSTSVGVNIGSSSSSSGSAGGSGGCSSIWSDCSVSECIGGTQNVTCVDVRCGRGDKTYVESCVVERPKIELLPPLPPPYRRNKTVGEVSGPVSEPEPELVNDSIELVVNDSIEVIEVPMIPEEEPRSLLGLFLILLLLLLAMLLFLRGRRKRSSENMKPELPVPKPKEPVKFDLPSEYLPAFEYIRGALKKGYSGEAIVEAFKYKGWDESQIDLVFKELRRKGFYK